EGVIAWQMHGTRPPEEVVFRDIEFKDLGRDARSGWQPLFNGKDLTNWVVDSGEARAWGVEDGELVAGAAAPANRGWLLTERSYGDFVLRLQFKLSPGANSGVAFRAVPGEKPPEIQLMDDSDPKYRDTP